MKILHLEMSQFFSGVIKKVAVASGHDYRRESTVSAGFSALEEGDFDLLITALVLKDAPAEVLLKQLAGTRHEDLPIIVVTSDDSVEKKEYYFELGVMDYLQKSDLIPKRIELYFKVLNRHCEIIEELKSFRIAVLDDSNVSLHVIRSIFRYYGINHAKYFQSPKAMLTAGDFDLYITDLVMPEMTGDELLIAVRGKSKTSGIIVVSGTSNRLATINALALGADDYIAKPFDAKEFIVRITRVVRAQLLLRELETQNRKMENLARRDSLTGLLNHGSIHEILERSMGTQVQALSVLLLDLDNFKTINDNFGHQVGDEVLIAASEVLVNAVGDCGEVGRYGGEEFLVVLPGFDADAARSMAEKILAEMRRIDLRRGSLKVTASCGIAGMEDTDKAVAMVEKSDERLYAAKDAGKNCVVG